MTSTTCTIPSPRFIPPTPGVPDVLNHRGLRFFAAGAGGDGGGQGGAGADGGGDGKGGDAGGYTPPATQADLDRIITDRVLRERSKYPDYDDLKTKAERLAELEAASASDLDKAVAKAKDEGKAEAQAAVNEVLIAAEVRAAAAEAKFKKPADALALLTAEGKLTPVKVTDGQADAEAVKTLVDALAKERDYLLESAGSGEPGVVPGTGTTGASSTPAPGMGSLRVAYANTPKSRHR